MREEKQLGQYFTPKPLIEFIVKRVVKNGDTVIDPSAGNGAFISYVRDNYKKIIL